MVEFSPILQVLKKEVGHTMSEKATFQDNLSHLEIIVEQLESGEVSLEDCFKLYKKGMKTLKTCHDHIDKIEKEIEIIKNDTK